jgi:zinc transport system substrate-binding protein
MVRNITDGLIEIDPDNEKEYIKNSDKYVRELIELDEEIEMQLAHLESRKFMVFHPAFGYFAQEYDLEMIPIEIEGKEPSAHDLEELIEEAKENNIRVVFASPQFNPQTAEVIAGEIDGTVEFMDPLAEDYIQNIRKMADALIKYAE